jgi:hypothetical protein
MDIAISDTFKCYDVSRRTALNKINKAICTYVLIWISTFLAFGEAHAALVGGAPVGAVKHYYSYSDFNTGDVVIQVATPPASCPGGFWVRMTDPGAKNVVAQLLAAVTSQIPLIIWGYDDQLWPGTATVTCRIYTVDYAL